MAANSTGGDKTLGAATREEVGSQDRGERRKADAAGKGGGLSTGFGRVHRLKEQQHIATSPDERPQPEPQVQDARPARISQTSLSSVLDLARSDTAKKILLEALRFARAREPREAPVVGATGLTRAFVRVGLDELVGMRRETPIVSSAGWLARWLEERADRTRTVAFAQPPGEPADVGTLLSQNALDVIDRACDYARRTVRRDTFDARHLVAALLTPRGLPLRQAASANFRRNLGVDLLDFAPMLLRNVTDDARREPEENSQAWREILGGMGRKVLPGFDADDVRVSGGDPLEIEDDVEAFARLIALDQAAALSIGLFGEWGSGKTTFMERLQKCVAAIAEEEKGRRARVAAAPRSAGDRPSDAGTKARLAANVVQIKFNAWHFADANLWASLTAEFFDQLRAGGAEKVGKALHARLVERVTAHVHSLAANAEATRKAVAESAKTLAEAQKARDEAVAAVDRAQDEVLSQTLLDAVSAAYQKHKADLCEIGRRAGQGDVTKGIDDFVALAKQARTLHGQLSIIAKVVWARGWRIGLMVVGGLLTFALIALALSNRNDAASLLSTLGVLLAAAGSVATALLPGIRLVGSIIGSTAAFADNLDQVDTKLKDVLASEAALNAATAEAKARHDAMERANRELARYIDLGASAAPPRLLRFVLEEDPDTKAIEQEVGLISRVRRLFQAVDEIAREEREKRRDGKAYDPDVPERVVLYIDDLDRCTHDQVYAVLQAVHLLLAFDLFVVVVGVDVGWIEAAVGKHFRSDAEPHGAPSVPAANGEAVPRTQAVDYLEKIFQIPFWLRRLTLQGPSGEAGTYTAYVWDLLKDNVATYETAGGHRVTSDQRQPADQGGKPEGQTAGNVEPQRPASSGAQGFAVAPDPEIALASITLEQEEADFLASPAIGALAGKSPRAVKRLINVYRVLRARLKDDELAAFLGVGDPPTYPIAALLAAIEVGQLASLVAEFNAKLAAADPGQPFTDLLQGDALPAEVAAAAGAVDQERRGDQALVRDYREMAARVRRYSFNRH